ARSKAASDQSTQAMSEAGLSAGDAGGAAVSAAANRTAASLMRRLRPHLLEQLQLPVFRLGDGDRVAAGEAGRAVLLARGVADGGQEPFMGEVGEAVGAD